MREPSEKIERRPLRYPGAQDFGEELRNLEIAFGETFGAETPASAASSARATASPWVKKRQALAEHSVLRMNARLQQLSDWNDDAIRHRGEQTFHLARSIWPIPEPRLVEHLAWSPHREGPGAMRYPRRMSDAGDLLVYLGKLGALDLLIPNPDPTLATAVVQLPDDRRVLAVEQAAGGGS